MHAEVKIVSFLVFGAAMSFGAVEELIVGTIVLVLSYALFARHYVVSALRISLRMRWFFLSIIIVYGFFSPGRLLLPNVTWGPTYEGLLQGGQRIAGLLMIVFAINLLLRTTSQPALVSSVLWCLHPLSWLGVPHERLAVRIALILDVVTKVQDVYRHGRRNPKPVTGLAARFKRMGATTNRLFQSVHEKAESAPLETITLPERVAIPFWQWGVPLALGAVFFGLNW
jgi:energy-coupling factor transport system permease protein